MAKKKINIILLILVLGLWGSVIYKLVKPYFIENKSVPYADNTNVVFKTKMQFKDTFEMKAIERDPFLNRLQSKPNMPPVRFKAESRTSLPNKKLPVEKNVPFIEYYGYIKSVSGKGKELIMIKNNGVLYKLKLGEERDGLKILKVFNDSMQFSFNKERYYVRKK